MFHSSISPRCGVSERHASGLCLGLCLLLLLLALFQERRWLELLLLLGWGLGGGALWGAPLRFGGQSGRCRGGVVGGESLHPFLQLLRRLLLFLASVLYGWRVRLCLFCYYRKKRKKKRKKNIQWTDRVLSGMELQSYMLDEHACLMRSGLSCFSLLTSETRPKHQKCTLWMSVEWHRGRDSRYSDRWISIQKGWNVANVNWTVKWKRSDYQTLWLTQLNDNRSNVCIPFAFSHFQGDAGQSHC